MSDRGTETVKDLGKRKKAVLNTGGNTLDLAVAMLETTRLVADYPFGDIYPNDGPKTGDAANFGIFKQGWLMIRSAVGQYAKLGSKDYRAGAALNVNLGWDIKVLHSSQQKLGWDKWFAGHRGGESGLRGTWSKTDINNYRMAIKWIRDQIDGNASYLTDDTRFWVDVPPV